MLDNMTTNFLNLVDSSRIFMIKLSSGSVWYILLDYVLLYIEYYLIIRLWPKNMLISLFFDLISIY